MKLEGKFRVLKINIITYLHFRQVKNTVCPSSAERNCMAAYDISLWPHFLQILSAIGPSATSAELFFFLAKSTFSTELKCIVYFDFIFPKSGMILGECTNEQILVLLSSWKHTEFISYHLYWRVFCRNSKRGIRKYRQEEELSRTEYKIQYVFETSWIISKLDTHWRYAHSEFKQTFFFCDTSTQLFFSSK